MATTPSRLRAALRQNGVDWEKPAEISRFIKLKTGRDINRQTVANWVKDSQRFMEPEFLWLMADALGVSARWLAAIDNSAMEKPMNLSLDEANALDLYRQLKALGKAQEWAELGQYWIDRNGKKTTV